MGEGESTPSTAAKPPAGDGPRPRYKRSAKNYLLDRHFQLKYTGFLVAITSVLSLALGGIILEASQDVLRQTQETVEQGKATVAQGEATVVRGQKVIEESDKVSQVVGSTIENCYQGDDYKPLLDSYKKDAAEKAQGLADEQAKLQADKKFLEVTRDNLEKNFQDAKLRQTQLLIGLGVVLLVLIFAIGVAGIVFTHKIAGPIFKMKRLFRQVGEGKLVLREKLRKGDELVHFFEAFEKMVDQLRDKQKREIEEVDVILGQLEAEKSDSAGVKNLRALRAEMVDHLEP
jgi:nitrogen fixation/metabolism regulation signal transduction histidine kinase